MNSEQPRRLPPWITREPTSTSYLANLAAEIQEFVVFARLTPEEVQARNSIFDRVKLQVTQKFKHALVYEYGSLPSGLSLYFSDIDIAVENVRLEQIEPLLEKQAYVKYINAHVPILKCRDYETGIEFDISQGGTAVIHDVQSNRTATDHEKSILLLLKHFLAQRGLNKPFTGGVSGHILSLLIRSFFGVQKQFYGDIQNHTTAIAQLFLQFLDFYGCRFNSANVAIVDLQFVRRRMFCSNTLCLIYNQTDVGSAVFNWVLIRRSFEAALLTILREGAATELEISVDSELRQESSILSRIMTPNEAGMRIRELCINIARNRDNSVSETDVVSGLGIKE